MNRTHNLTQGPLFWACALGVACLIAPAANAALVINLRFTDGSTSKIVSSDLVGTSYLVNVWATITGTDSDNTNDGLNAVYFGAQTSIVTPSVFTGNVTARTLSGDGGSVGAQATTLGSGTVFLNSIGGDFGSIQNSSLAPLGTDGKNDVAGNSSGSFSGFMRASAGSGTYYTSGTAPSNAQMNLLSSPYGLEFLIGQITVTSDYLTGSLPGGTTNAFQLSPVNPSTMVPSATRATWQEDGSIKTVATGGTLTMGSSVMFQTVGTVATSYTLGVSAGSLNVLKGANATNSITTTITNVGGATADTLNYTGLGSTSAAGGTVNNGTTTGGPVANSGGTGTNVTQTFSGTSYGSVVVTSGVATATNATLGGNATQSGSSGSITYNVGEATAASSGASNLNSFVTGNALMGDVAALADYDGISSRTTAGGNVVGTEAILVAGKNVSGTLETLVMNWRDRADIEKSTTATSPPIPVAGFGLVSDIVKLTGMSKSGGGTSGDRTETDVFALQMSYDDTLLPGVEATLAAKGSIYLGWLDTDYNGTSGPQATDLWKLAVAGNFGSGSSVFTNQPMSWTSFVSAHSISNTNIGDFLGSWGVDTANNVVWAVLNHNSQFAVVPEPTTCLLLGCGGLGLVLGWRRRRRTAA